MELTKENLIAEGKVRFHHDGKRTVFSVEDLKEHHPKYEAHKANIETIEADVEVEGGVEKVELQVVALDDLRPVVKKKGKK